MRRSRYWLAVFLLVLMLATAGYLALQARLDAGKGLPEFSVLSDEENGLATAARVLGKLGFRPVALSRPIQHTQHQGVLILAEPQQKTMFGTFTGLSDNDAKGLLSWVAKGNTLVLLTRSTNALHQQLGVTLVPDRADETPVYQAEAEEIGGFTEPLDRQTMRVESLGVEGKDMVQGSKGVPLWFVGNKPGAWLVPHGEGRVLVSADPSLWTHRGLVRRDNVLLLYNIARIASPDGRVFFDEYHHGIRSGGGYWDYLRFHHLHWLALQLLAVAGIAAWGTGVRLGPPRATPLAAGADAVDYASAVARIYQRTGVHRLLAQHLVRDFLAALTRQLHLRPTTTLEEILKTAQQRLGSAAARELGRLLDTAGRMRDVDKPQWRFSRKELLSVAKRFDEMISGLQNKKPITSAGKLAP